MVPLLALLQTLGPFAWFILGAVLLIAETLLPGASLIWFGVAASLTGGLLFIWPLAWEGQMIAFIVLSCVTVVIGRVIASWQLSGDGDTVNRGAAALVGRELPLAEPIVDGFGRARWGDGLWRVRGPDRPAGTRVRVIGVEAATLLVEPVAGGGHQRQSPDSQGSSSPDRADAPSPRGIEQRKTRE